MSHSDTTLMAPMELNQLLQFHNLEMTEESLLSLFPKLIRINEVCRVTVLLLTLFPNVNFRNDSSTWHFRGETYSLTSGRYILERWEAALPLSDCLETALSFANGVVSKVCSKINMGSCIISYAPLVAKVATVLITVWFSLDFTSLSLK